MQVEKVEIKIEAKPTVGEIRDIVETYANDHAVGAWEDVGFVVENSAKLVWASRYRLTENISVEDEGEPIFDAEKLYRKIAENRARYLAPIIKDAQIQQEQAAANG